MVRIWKISDNGTVTVATDCTTAEDFERLFSDALIEYVETAYPPGTTPDGSPGWAHDLHHDMPQIIGGAFGILCKLRGYKADDIGEQRLLFSGHAMPTVQEGMPCVECK